MAGTTDIIAVLVNTTDGALSVLNPDSNNITVLSGAGQVVGGVVGLTVDVSTSLGLTNIAGIAGITGFVTAVKVSIDVQDGRDVALGDVINLVANGVTIVAGVAVISGAAVPLGILVTTLGLVSAAAGFYANQNGWTVNDLTNTLFTASQSYVQPRRDPLVFDLDGDGIETTGINTNAPIYFDHDGDGIQTATGWIKADDALLVLDRNGNNQIDSGRELFGDATPLGTGGTAADGFAARILLSTTSLIQISKMQCLLFGWSAHLF